MTDGNVEPNPVESFQLHESIGVHLLHGPDVGIVGSDSSADAYTHLGSIVRPAVTKDNLNIMFK